MDWRQDNSMPWSDGASQCHTDCKQRGYKGYGGEWYLPRQSGGEDQGEED